MHKGVPNCGQSPVLMRTLMRTPWETLQSPPFMSM
jgi:hypothetical protein